MFLDNKYTKIYYQIINRAKNRILEGYSERHHVIPKSMGGSNSKENLVTLTGREHFVCHLLLTKMTTNEHLKKMITAFIIMTGRGSNSAKDAKIKRSSKWFQKIRAEYAKIVQEKMTGRIVADSTKEKLRISATGRKYSDEVNASKGRKGREPTPKTPAGLKKISEASSGRKHTVETKKKISDNLKGEKNPFFGKKHTQETLEKIKQQNLDPEVKRKRSERVIGDLNPAKRLEVRQKISQSQKIRLANKKKLKVDIKLK